MPKCAHKFTATFAYACHAVPVLLPCHFHFLTFHDCDAGSMESSLRTDTQLPGNISAAAVRIHIPVPVPACPSIKGSRLAGPCPCRDMLFPPILLMRININIDMSVHTRDTVNHNAARSWWWFWCRTGQGVRCALDEMKLQNLQCR